MYTTPLQTSLDLISLQPLFSVHICAVSLILFPLLLFIVVNFRVKSFKVETNISNWQPNVGWWQQLLLLLFCLISFCHSYSYSYRKQSIVNVNKVYDLSMLFLHLSFTFFFYPASLLSSMCVLRQQKRKKSLIIKNCWKRGEKGCTFSLIKTKICRKKLFWMQPKILLTKMIIKCLL